MAERTTQPISLLFIFALSFNAINGATLNFNVNEDVQVESTLSSSLPTPEAGFHYTLFDGDPVAGSLFAISASGKITVKKELKYVVGKRNKYELIAVKRKDGTTLGGKPEVVHINVLDVNNHDPVFKKTAYEGHISEGLKAGSPVRGLEDCFATDQDSSGISRYIITSGNNFNLFKPKIKDISGLKLLVIETTGTLDREALKATPYIHLEVKAIDGGNPARFSAPTKIRIRILDKNDNTPVFDQANWIATIQENSPIMTSVIKVRATDKDEGSNSQLYYFFKELQKDFFVDPYTGAIYVAAPLSYRKKNSYKITVVVIDRAVQTPLNSSTTVLITVVDVAGYPTASSMNRRPEFKTKKFDVRIRGDMPVNTFVLLARATDEDGIGNNNGELEYSMTAFGANPFTINKGSGVISVSSKLPTITTPLNFEVSVKDGGHLTAKVPVEISIRSINTNPGAPVFNPTTVNVDIKEDASKTFQVFKAYATDSDGLKYSITGGTGLGRFAIDANTGVVTPKVTFKPRAVYDLYIQARDTNLFKLSSTMYARVNVKFSDVAKPVFSKAMYVAQVEEEAAPGTFVTAVFTNSPNPSKSIKYIAIGNMPAGISLDSVSGVITTTQRLDYEVIQKLTLTIQAEEGGVRLSKTLVEIKIKNKNDEMPVFPRPNINLRVPENMGYIPNLVCLFATDKDGTLTKKLAYSIVSGNDDNVFSIDKETGQFSVQNLDFEKKSAYDIKVQATDGKNVASANVKVVVENDVRSPEPPNFGAFKHLASIQENSPSMTTVKDMPVVGSSGSFSCDFGFDATPLIMSLFTIKTKYSSCLVETSAVLKWSKKHPSYKFTVRAVTKTNSMQFSSAELKVAVLDANDHMPEFTQDSYATSVQVSSKIGSSVLSVAATDEDEGSNGALKFNIISTADSNRFNIDEKSGLLSVRDNLVKGKQYQLTVRASDQGSPPKTKDVKVTVSVLGDNVELPKFGAVDKVSLSEEIPMGNVLSAKATITGGTIDHVIVGGNTGSVFNIDANGLITHNQMLDFETKSEYKVVVRATKRGSNPPVVAEKIFTVTVLDANDNTPQFNVKGDSIEVTIGNNAPTATVVSMYKAFDKDSGSNGALKYTLIVNAGSTAVPFTANADSGIVSSTQEITSTGTYNLVLRAADQGTPPKSKDLAIKVTVIAGTKPPSFTDTRFKGNLDDNSPVGRSVGSVSIKDNTPNDFIQYDIAYGNEDNSFCIDFSKNVYVQKHIDRDITKKDRYSMTVIMKYKNRVSSTLFSVNTKTDDNDNSPVFSDGYGAVTKTIPESSGKGTLLYQVRATDNDKDLKGSIEYSLFQVYNKYSVDKFSVSVNGEVTLNNLLDYEQLDEHIITIKAAEKISSPQYALKNVVIKVTDKNDEAPLFSNPRYEAEIRKDAKAGDIVLQLYASDLDSGKNGEVFYELTNDKFNVFAIDRATGIITLRETIALATDSSFNLAAKATDKGIPAKSGQANVIVRTITSDGVPKFALSKFEFEVEENTVMKGTVKAISVDPLTYSIISGNTANRFQINKYTGDISSIHALDAEQGEIYTLTILAKDNSERSSTTKAIIKVKNINDNEPIFPKAVNGLIEKVITNKVVMGEILLKAEGQDLDNGDLLTYEIIEKAQQEQFKIEPSTGEIKLKKPLGTLNAGQNFAEFTVRATDRGTPKKTKDVKVRIVFANFRPDQVKIKRSVPETAAVSTSPVVVDLPRVYPLGSYQIMYPKVHPFKINAITGEIYVAKQLDFEKVQYYDVVIQENNSQDKKQFMNYKLGITVLDANDNTPVFNMPNLKAKINANARIGTEVIKLIAKDPDSGSAGKVSFEIVTPNVPFTINPVTNQIELSKMNSLTSSKYLVDVKASDSGIPKRSSGQVKIEISVVNEPPVFGKNLYQFTVSEKANVDKVLGTVKAKSLSGIAVTYKITKGNTGDKFRVDSNGNVLLQRPLDYEFDQSSFSLVVEASEIAATSLKSTTNVVIQVENINDNPPHFTQVEYKSAAVREDVKVNHLVMTVSATDKDCGANGVCTPGFLTYSTKDFSDTFRLDPITGEIRTVRSLDADQKKTYKFNIKVEDSGKIKRSAIAGVIITVQDVNDNAPVFTPDRATLYISERTANGVVIIVVEAKDVDNDRLTYAFASGNEKNLFAIDSLTGKVTVRDSQFFVFKYQLKISASDGKHTGFFILTINIDDKNDKSPVFKKCLDYKPNVYENSPIGTKVITVTATDDDEGRNGEIEYSLLQISSKGVSQSLGNAPENVGSSETNDFVIDKKNGEIRTKKQFDRERIPQYTVIAIARDGGPNRTVAERNSAACQLTIVINDLNDMKPVFAISSYEVSVWDQTPVNTVILQASALDADVGKFAQVEYSLNSRFGSKFLIPDKTNGKIVVGSRLTVGEYKFKVVAGNPGMLNSSVDVTVTVGLSKPPKFTKEIYTTSIKEDEKAGFEIKSVQLKAFGQNGASSKIVYNLPKGSLIETNMDVFAINSETGVLKVAGELNYEVTKKYVVYAQAKDESNNMLTYAIVYINILDVNDNTPLFFLPKYEFVTVTEGQGAGVVVGKVYASDKDSTTNAELTYKIMDGPNMYAFSINSNTGVLTTNKTFDREKKGEQEISFHVLVADKGAVLSQTSNIYVAVKIIDINDNAPVFVKREYNGEVKEDVLVNHKVIMIQATDKDAGDNAKVQFYITGGNEQGYFSTSKATFSEGTSTAYIIVAKPLDRESKAEFKLTITASDSKFNVQATANIKVLDANDNAPAFLQSVYTGSINEGSKSGIIVTTVTAVDKDSAAVQQPIKYLLGKDSDGMFKIDSTTGVITTGDKEFDREKKDEYRFTVIATDGKLQGTALVKCTIKDINDEAPYFPGAPYTRYVKEEQPAGTVVGYVPARDNDDVNAGNNAKITYSIEGNNNGFTIRGDTGLITTLKKFNRENKQHTPVYKITVRAKDGGVPVQKNDTVVTIIVTDANDNDPKFTKAEFNGKIKECAPVGSVITTVTAEDADDPKTVNAQLMYYVINSNNKASYFHVDDRTGVVTTADGLDYEKSSRYELKVGVKDRGVPQRPVGRDETTTVVIEVTDCNDNQPIFIPSSYKVSVLENAVVGQTILMVTAVDKDGGSNGEVTFKVVDTEKNFRFDIKNAPTNNSKGIVTLLYPMDREDIPYHVFKVSASDKGIPTQTGYANVNISLIDVNDNGPHFDKPDYCGKVEEEKLGYQKVAKIRVSDPDTLKYSCPCTFSLEKGDTSKFELKNADGNSVDIVTKATAIFDREAKSVYTLYIAAFDQGKPPMKNVTFVKVEVLDKNDNEPKSGGSLSLLVNAYKGKFIGGPVGKIYITDSDEGSNDIYSHKLTSQSPGKLFSVNEKTGDVIAPKDVPVGVYKLAFRSTESNRKVGDHLSKTVTSSAVVTVRAISEKQAKTSVAIRMTGLVKSSTCKQLAYPEFEELLAKILGVDKKLVTVFSAQEVKDLHRGVDIRFAVKKTAKPGYAGDDSEYVSPINLIPLLNTKKAEIEKASGGKVASIGIDPCAKETCQVGFCYNEIQPQRTYSVVTDDNGLVPANPSSKTFISIDMKVIATCRSKPIRPENCKSNPCLYGGKCTDLKTGGYVCKCNKKSLGPECQVSMKSFKTKNSYVWLKPVNYFYEGTLSFEFITKEANGILLYQGPVSKIKATETKDFIAVELVQGKLQISVNQGDRWRIFKKIVASKETLNNGVFHHVSIYKRGKFIRVTIDKCRTAMIVESSKGSYQNRSNCEITGTIGGPYKFINGMNPLQLGGIKQKDLKYPPLTTKDSFAGCLRNVYDNGIMYDLSKVVEERDIGLQCPFFAKCPTCYNGVCRTTVTPFVCICDFGWTGVLCNERVGSQHYLANSYTEYSFPSQRVKRLAWQDKYTSLYKVQVRTKVDGFVVYEASSMTYGALQEYSILEVVNKTLQYRYNVGDGANTLILRNVVVGDGKWHNVTLHREGNFASLNVEGKGMVSGRVGTHRLLETNGLIYAGGVPSKLNVKESTDMQGCLADYRIGEKNLDGDPSVKIRRVNVEKTCPCLFMVCLNGGICHAGSPPYCICPPGYTGADCSILVTQPEAGSRAVMATGSLLGLVVIVVVFLLAVVLAALLIAGKFAGKKTVPVYVDDDPRDNIMPYHDEGAGEDDFHNYDLEKLLKHAGAARGAGLANGAAVAGGGAGGKDIEKEPLLAREDVGMVNAAAAGVVKREKHARFEAANVESVDVARFITSRLGEADTEDAAYPRDTLLHYGYEGEGSDVDDLSELGDSEDESDDDEADFMFLQDWGAKFDNLNKIFNPPSGEFDEDV